MRRIKINFVDFWPNFLKNDNYFYNLLATKYEVEIDEQNPDLLFFSVDYQKQKERDRYANHPCKKIFYTGENVRSNLNFPGSIEHSRYSIGKSDFAFSFDETPDPREYRLPLWVLFINWFNVKHSDHRDQSYLIPLDHVFKRNINVKNRFCNFVFSNTSGERLNILDHLMGYKHVDCAGPLRNNVGHTIAGRGDQKQKIDFLKDYKFTIAAENSSSPGYTTEKIIHPLSVGSIPIYWGSGTVADDFNEGAFINVNNYNSMDDLVEHIESVDQNPELYEKYITAPIFNNNKISPCFLPENVLYYIEENIL